MSLSQRLQEERQAKRARTKPPRTVTVLNKSMAWRQMQGTLARSLTTPTNDDDVTALLLEPLAHLDLLTHGSMEYAGFVSINTANCEGYQLARILEADNQTRGIFLEAAAALQSIAERYKTREVFGATGDELNSVRRSLSAYEEIIRVAARGHVCTAITEAEKMIEGWK